MAGPSDCFSHSIRKNQGTLTKTVNEFEKSIKKLKSNGSSILLLTTNLCLKSFTRL